KGDAFAARNDDAMNIDFVYQPPMFEVSPTHYAATWLMHEKAAKKAENYYKNQQLSSEKDVNTAEHKEKVVSNEKLIEVNNLKQHFTVGRKNVIKAVDGLTFDIYKGETFGLVGESGCGKSTTGRTLIQLHQPTQGEIKFEGSPLTQHTKFNLSKKIQMIFQDPQASLNPRWNIGDIIAEGLTIHKMYDKKEKRKYVSELLNTVGLQKEHMNRFPHEFSGGQRQRVGIARALAVEPELIIAD